MRKHAGRRALGHRAGVSSPAEDEPQDQNQEEESADPATDLRAAIVISTAAPGEDKQD
jgi:hypothetical protein